MRIVTLIPPALPAGTMAALAFITGQCSGSAVTW